MLGSCVTIIIRYLYYYSVTTITRATKTMSTNHNSERKQSISKLGTSANQEIPCRVHLYLKLDRYNGPAKEPTEKTYISNSRKLTFQLTISLGCT